MLPPVDERRRAVLLRAAGALCTVTALLAPLAGRTTVTDMREPAGPRGLLPLPAQRTQALAPYHILRDPFAGGEPSAGALAPAAVQLTASVQSAVLVRAVVLGEHARALVEEGGTARIVAVGERIDGLVVERITQRGVFVSGGRF